MFDDHPWIWFLAALFLLTSLCGRVYAASSATGELASSLFPPKRFRTPQWPLKTERTLLTDEQIQRARRACETDPDAAAIRDKIVETADYWVVKSDEYYREMLPGGEVPRAFNVSARGCPVHGTAIYKHGTYPWIIDPERPFVVKCPEGGEEYPSNDFAAYRNSGMKDRSLLTGDYPDDGRGFVPSEGEKYWFVGYACHWVWHRQWRPAVEVLAKAYILTGERKYAHKCLVMLDRIAECYPDFDYDSQSRYSELIGGGYEGKIVNRIWETRTLESLAESYDYVFDALIGPEAISFPHRTSEQIRANIEANILEEGIDCVSSGLVAGNWGMHQSALASTVLTRQNGPTMKLLDPILENIGGGYVWNTGVNYMLYNQVFADGMPFETSPGYCSGWVNSMARIADALRPSGIDLYANPKVRQMFDAFLDLICIGATSPSLGDAGNIGPGYSIPQASSYRSSFRATGNPRYAWASMLLDPKGAESDYRVFEDLFVEPLSSRLKTAAESHDENLQSRLLGEYGWAALNNEKNTVGLSIYYGLKAGHGHFDRLGIDIYAHGRKMAPDLGYPDFMNVFVPGIYTWSKNTISHNTVVVDKQRQLGNVHGRVLRFHPGRQVQVVDVAAEGTYPQTSVYRRTLVQIQVDADRSYFVDVFRVAGGANHILSVHGIPGTFAMSGMHLSEPQKEGTVAGEDVPYGAIYDNAKMGAPDYKGGFSGYAGSGLQHLFNAQEGRPGASGVAEWKDDEGVGLRARIMPAPDQQLTVADAYVSPTQKVPDVIKYILAEREDSDSSCFITVWEPFKGEAFIQDVAQLTDAASDEAVGLKLTLTDGREHTVLIAPDSGTMRDVPNEFATDSSIVVLERNEAAISPLLALEGTRVECSGQVYEVPQGTKDEIEHVDYPSRTVSLDASGLSEGDWVEVRNDPHSSFRRITSLADGEIGLGDWDLFCARVRVASIDHETQAVVAKSPLPWQNYLVGTHVVNEEMKPVAKVLSVNGNTLVLDNTDSLAHTPDEPMDIFLSPIGPGDEVRSAGYLEEMETGR